MLKYCTFLYLQPCREREEAGLFVRGRISDPVVACRCHSVGLVLGPSPANVSLQVGLGQSWRFPQRFPPCWESSTVPDGFPAATEGSAPGWHTVLGAGQKPRGWTGRIVLECCRNEEFLSWMHRKYTDPSPAGMAYCTQFPGTHPARAAGSVLCFPAGHRPPEGKGSLERPVPIPKNCPERP